MNQRIAALAAAGLIVSGAGPAWAAGEVELTTRVSGVVESVLVKPGQSVRKGTVLLRLDRTILQAHLQEARAEEARAEADAADAEREKARALDLYDRTVSSTSERDASLLRAARAQAALSSARAHRVIAQKNLADAELRAPFDGVVSAVPGWPGTVVAADCQPKPLVVLKPAGR